MKEFFKRIHTDHFRWYDQIFVAAMASLLLTVLGSFASIFIVEPIKKMVDAGSPFFESSL